MVKAFLLAALLQPSLLRVEAVVDGDTIKVEHIGTIRLIGVDTPETVHPRKPIECMGPEATHFMRGLLAESRVYVITTGKDRYQRTLAYVYREDNVFVNLELIERGYSKSYTEYEHDMERIFNDAEQTPRFRRLGVWSCPDEKAEVPEQRN